MLEPANFGPSNFGLSWFGRSLCGPANHRRAIRSFLRHGLVAAALAFTAGGCKAKTCRPGEFQVQVLVHPGEPLSMDPEDETRSLPVNVRMYQLANRDPVAHLDLDALRADAKAALGEAFIAEEKFEVWPSIDDLRVIRPKPQTQHILLVAEFRKIIGVGWYLLYDIPPRDDHEAAVCTAVARKKPPIADPCFYVMLERYEMRGGGAEPPAGMPDDIRIRGKVAACAPGHYDIDPKIKNKRRRLKRRQLRFPNLPFGGLPAAPAPAAPAVPSPSAAPLPN